MTLSIGDFNAKVGREETQDNMDKFGLGVRNERGRRLVEFCMETKLVCNKYYIWVS